MTEFKIDDIVELKDVSHGNNYYKITDISIDKSVVWAMVYSKNTDSPWIFYVRLETSRLKHYKTKSEERTSIYDKF